MTNVRLLSLLTLALMIVPINVPSTMAAANYSDNEEDPAGDVGNDDSLMLVEGYSNIDILSVSVTASDNDITLSVTLAGEASPYADYSVSLTADGSDRYYLKYFFGNFTGLSFVTLESLDLEGSVDGTVLSWVIDKSEIPVTDSLEINRAVSTLQESDPHRTLIDVAPQYGPSPGDGRWDLIVELVSTTHLRQTAVQWVEHGDYEDFRAYTDSSGDGTVTQDEVDAVIDGWEDPPETEADWTCDGLAPKSTEFRIELDGLLGPVDSTDTIKFSEIFDVQYADIPEGESHVYASSEWLSPKTNEDVKDESVFRFIAPPGWRFDTTDWSDELKEYINEDSTVLEIDGLTIRYRFVDVMGDVDSLAFIEEPVEVEDGSPGFGALAVISALLVAFMLAFRRRTFGWDH